MKYLVLLLLTLASCNAAENRTSDTGQNFADSPEFYEGRVPIDEQSYLYCEVSLYPSVITGEGKYDLKESIEGATSVHTEEMSGSYSSVTDKEGSAIITLHGSARTAHLVRVYTTVSGKIRTENFRDTDLTFVRNRNERLIVLDRYSRPVSLSYRHNLVKRTSDIFTIEGYFRHKEDTAEFYEMNTQTKWPIAKMGAFMDAAQQYYSITSRKNEPIYLKGTGFVVELVNAENKRVRALVFKKILQTTSVSSE
jgi:hypothetical protein